MGTRKVGGPRQLLHRAVRSGARLSPAEMGLSEANNDWMAGGKGR